MIEIIGNIVDLYLVPLLKFTETYIDPETCELKPVNVADKDLVYKYEGKDVVVVRNDREFGRFRDRKEEFEIYNPFLVPKHMIFLANLVKAKLNTLVEPYSEVNVKMEYDDDLDEWIPKDPNVDINDLEIYCNIGIFQRKLDNGLTEVAFSYIDSSGNSIKPIIAYEAIEPTMAIYGVCLEAFKMFQMIIPPQLKNTEQAGNAIYALLAKYEKERINMGKIITGFQGLDMTSGEDTLDNTSYDMIDFKIEPFTPKKYFTPKSAPLIRKALQAPIDYMDFEMWYLPEFRIEEEEKKEVFDMSMDLSEYENIDFI